MKVKHNKKRNTAFLFEALVKELTKTVIEKNKKKTSLIKSIIVSWGVNLIAMKLLVVNPD